MKTPLLPFPAPPAGCAAPLLLLVLTLAAAPITAAAQDSPAGLDEMRRLAKSLVESGLYDEAVEAYREISRYTPDQARSHYELASTLIFLRRNEEALIPLAAAERLDPGDPRYPSLAALAHLSMHHYSQAAAASRRGAALGDVQAMYTLSGMYQRGLGVQADPRQALHWIRRAAEGGHLGAMDLLVQTYREGLFEQAPDPARAEHWARRLRAAEAAVP